MPPGPRGIKPFRQLYLHEPLAEAALGNCGVSPHAYPHAGGRTYAGGLVKFEPGELELIVLPSVEDICDYVIGAKPGGGLRLPLEHSAV